MRTTSRILCRIAALWLLAAAPVFAQTAMQSPYARTRPGAEQWSQRGGGYAHRGGFGRGRGGFYDPYFYGFAGPIVQGSWYQRPYPYHFDYYRQRWGGEPGSEVRDVPPPVDCPCAVDAPVYDVPTLTPEAAS